MALSTAPLISRHSSGSYSSRPSSPLPFLKITLCLPLQHVRLRLALFFKIAPRRCASSRALVFRKYHSDHCYTDAANLIRHGIQCLSEQRLKSSAPIQAFNCKWRDVCKSKKCGKIHPWQRKKYGDQTCDNPNKRLR